MKRGYSGSRRANVQYGICMCKGNVIKRILPFVYKLTGNNCEIKSCLTVYCVLQLISAHQELL